MTRKEARRKLESAKGAVARAAQNLRALQLWNASAKGGAYSVSKLYAAHPAALEAVSAINAVIQSEVKDA